MKDDAAGVKLAARKRWLQVINAAGLLLCALSFYVICCVLLELHKVPELNFLEHYEPVGNTRIYDHDDKLICSVETTERRTVIPLRCVTPHLQRAVLTAEDRHFYEHQGVDIIGIARACFVNVASRHAVQGGSTITQQLAKNLFFEGSKRSLSVKIAEAIVAYQLEHSFSKEKILELYLNEVYFGNGAYGIEQAANRYFDKTAAQLTVGESAYVAGLICWPSRGGLQQYRKENIKRQRGILDAMLDSGYITKEQWRQACAQKLVFKSRPEKIRKCPIARYPYYISYVLDVVHGMYTEGEIQRHGLKVYTNLDQSAQEAAERVLEYGVRHAPAGVNQAALVSLNVRDGAVLALVGGVGDYMKNQWNCATNPHTVGSAFKPFVYLAAFNRGLLNPGSVVEDAPLVIPQDHQPDYKPKNYDGKYLGPITVAEAVAYSRNTCAVRVARQVGIDSVIETAHRAGIRQNIAPQISAALGCSAASPLELAGAYATLARGGIYIRPNAIRRIDDKNGVALFRTACYSERVFDQQPVAQIVDVLQEVVAQGTGTQARLADRPVAGKTGTADQAKDLWFVGFTPDLVTAVWAGNADNKPIPGSHITGGTVMARIWREYNRSFYANHNIPPSWFLACTHIAGSYKFPTREAVSETKKDEHVAPPVVRYEDIDPSARGDDSGLQRPAPVYRAGKGVVDYRWSR